MQVYATVFFPGNLTPPPQRFVMLITLDRTSICAFQPHIALRNSLMAL